MLNRVRLSRLATVFDGCRTVVLNNSENIKRAVVLAFDLSVGIASALVFLWLVGTAKVVYLDGIFAALACAMASVIAAFRATEAAERWPVSILSSAGARRRAA